MQAIQSSLSYLTCGAIGGPTRRRAASAALEPGSEPHEARPAGNYRLSNSTMAWLVGSVSASTLILSLSTLIGRTPFNRPEESKALVLHSDSSAVSASAPLRGGVLSSSRLDGVLNRQLRTLESASSTAPKYGVNLVKNWSGEDFPFTVYGWELEAGTWSRWEANYGGDTKTFAFGTNSANAKLFQTIDLTPYAADIASGKTEFFAYGVISGSNLDSTLRFEFLTSDGQISLGTFSKGGYAPFEIMDRIPIGSGQVKVQLITAGSGYNPYTRFDSITFLVKQNPTLSDAYVGEPYSDTIPTQAFPYLVFTHFPTTLTLPSGENIPDHIQYEPHRRRVDWRPTASEIGTHTFLAAEGSPGFADQFRFAPVTITVKPSRRQNCSVEDLGLTYGANLISNPSAELTPVTAYGWTSVAGVWSTSTSTGVTDGSNSFFTTSANARMSQIIDICSHRVPIDRGKQHALFSATISYNAAEPRAELYFLDSLGRTLSFSHRYASSGALRYIEPIPRDAASVEINLLNKGTGYGVHIAFDRISFVMLKPLSRERVTAGTSFSKGIPAEVYGNDASMVLTMQWADGQKLPSGAAFDTASRTFSWAPIGSDFVGLNQFNVRLTNPTGDSFHDVPFPILVTKAPTTIRISKAYIPHDANSGTEVGTLQSDSETHHNPLTYSLVAGTGDTNNDLFNIVDNRLILSTSLPGTTQTLSIRVEGSDCAGNTIETALTFYTEDAGKRAATHISLSYDRVSEQADPGTVVGTLGTDISKTLITHYELEAGPGDYDNAKFIISGTQVKTAEAISYRATPHHIRVAAVSVDGVRTAQELDITVQPCSFHS